MRLLLHFATAFATLAGVGAVYLTTLSGQTGGCMGGAGCGEVLSSRWAYWFGAPVSIGGIAAYVALAIATLRLSRSPLEEEARRRYWTSSIGLSAAILSVTLWFVSIQWVVLRAFCVFCLLTHTSAVLAAALTLRAGIAARRHESFPVDARRLASSSAVGTLAILGVLIPGQLFGAPPQRAAAQTRVRVTNPGDPAPSRVLSLHDGRVRLDLLELPVRGSPRAPMLIVSLFDYTCPYCRQTHHLVQDLERRYGSALGVISLPMPLDSACNSLVRATPPVHANACEYARLGLAVWHAQSGAFAEFDDWVFAGEVTPSIDEARDKARTLVGATALAGALEDGWVERQLQTNIELYGANSQWAGDGRMPQLMIGELLLHGAPGTLDELARILEGQRGKSLRAG